LATISTPAVNIADDKDEFRIEVAAPGLNKDDFKINLENNELTISANKEIKNEEKTKPIPVENLGTVHSQDRSHCLRQFTAKKFQPVTKTGY